MPFWTHLALYLLPFALAFGALTGLMLYLGESAPQIWIAQAQQADAAVLYRPQYGIRDLPFKQTAANLRRAEVLAIGSSRILQFRAGFFNRRPQAFYNAAAPAWRLRQVAEVIYALDRQALPRVLILSIDPPWFHPDYPPYDYGRGDNDYQHLFRVNRSVMQDIITGRALGRVGFDPASYLQRREPGGSGGTALGLRALRDGHGFRSDGSEQYGDFLVAGWLNQQQQRQHHLRLMRRGEDMYLYGDGDSLSEPALAELDALLAYAQDNGVTVIGFLPSYEPELWARMMARGDHTYITALTPRLRSMFEARGLPFFDFSDGASVDSTSDEFFDGWHASELSNLRLYLRMLEALPDLLGPYSDADALRAAAANARSTWDVFGFASPITPDLTDN